MNRLDDSPAVVLVGNALSVLKAKPPEHWGLVSSIANVCKAGDDIPNRMGVNFRVVLNNGIGVYLEVIDEEGVPCSKKSGRRHGINYLIERIRVFCNDSLPKVIRRVVDCINRTFNILMRKEASRKHWKSLSRKQKKFYGDRPSQTLVIPKFNVNGEPALIPV